MRRPMVVIAAAVLSGILYGLPGIPFVYRLVSAGFSAGSLVLQIYRCRGRYKLPLYFFAVLSFSAFMAGFLRASEETQSFLRYAEFYEKYEATNPGEFDYAEYLKSINVKTEEERKALKTRNRDNETPVIRKLRDFREECGQILDICFPDTDSGVMKAMLLGDKQEMNEDIKSLYQMSGTAHLLAVSGLHVSMIGTGVSLFMKKMVPAGRKTVSVISTAAVFLYALFTGASFSSLRAAIMFCIGTSSIFFGRKKDIPSSLGFAAVCILLYRPYAVKQSGFQLSFLAISGIIYADWISKEWKRGKAAAVCFGVTFFTMPAVAFSYYKLPFYSAVLNLAVIPLMTAVFVSGTAVLLLGAVLPSLGVIAGTPAHLILKIYSCLSEISLKLPGAQMLTGKPGHIQIVLYYFLILTAGMVIRSLKCRKQARAILAAVYLVSFPFLKYRETDGTYVTVLDVGQGDCFHIHDSDTDILIDCGSTGYESAGSRILENYLLAKAVDSLDLTVVTHADSDHTNGILYLYSSESAISCGPMCLPFLASVDKKYDRLKEAAQGNFLYCREGDSFASESLTLKCIYSEEDPAAVSDTNRESAVMYLTAGNFRMLFTGDITEKEERRITEEYGLVECRADVLKCSHHGSDTASSEKFLKAVDPSEAVLSYGKNNRYGHPSETVTDRLEKLGIRVLSTEKNGALTFRIGSEGYEISSYRTDP